MMWNKNKWILIPVALIAIFSILVRIKIINGSLPYIGHPDEQAITSPSIKILKSGDLNPHTFVYPSLPFYLTAASFVVGYVNSVSHGDIRNTKEIGRVTYPFFSQKRIVLPAKLFFALLSVTGMVLIGIIAYNVSQEKHMIYLAPLLLSLSSLYLNHSAKYLNVDIIGSFFAVLAVFYIISRLESDSFLQKAIMPGILCGLAIASKYNYYPLFVPSVLAIIFYSKKQRFEKVTLLFFMAIITFIVCVPYSILDFNTFLDGIVFNIYHYKSGHPGFTGPSGLPQLFYYIHGLTHEYGLGFMAFTVLGIFFSLVSKPKKGIILLSFPLLLLIYLSSLEVHFMRNILVVYVFSCIYCAFGIVLVFKYLNSILNKRPYLAKHKTLQTGISVLFIAAIISIFLPIKKIVSAYDLKPDSRNLSINWIDSNVPPGSIIFVPEELDLDTRELEKKYKIKYFDGMKLKSKFSVPFSGAYVLIPHYGYDPRKKKGKEISDRLNRSFRNIDKIVAFGKMPVLVNYSRPVPKGNPKFYIGKIQ